MRSDGLVTILLLLLDRARTALARGVSGVLLLMMKGVRFGRQDAGRLSTIRGDMDVIAVFCAGCVVSLLINRLQDEERRKDGDG